jgi:hypothetical protein
MSGNEANEATELLQTSTGEGDNPSDALASTNSVEEEDHATATASVVDLVSDLTAAGLVQTTLSQPAPQVPHRSQGTERAAPAKPPSVSHSRSKHSQTTAAPRTRVAIPGPSSFSKPVAEKVSRALAPSRENAQAKVPAPKVSPIASYSFDLTGCNFYFRLHLTVARQ